MWNKNHFKRCRNLSVASWNFVDAIFPSLKKLKFLSSLVWILFSAKKRLHCQKSEKRITLKSSEINQWPRGILSRPFLAIWKRWNWFRLFLILFMCKKGLHCQSCEKRITLKGAENNGWSQGILSRPFLAIWKRWNCSAFF